MKWLAGQNLTLVNAQEASRSYSIISRPEDYYLAVDMRIYSGGALSSWFANDVNVGDRVRFRGLVQNEHNEPPDISRKPTGTEPMVHVTDAVFADHPALSGHTTFLCGNPDVIETARIAAVDAGAELDQIIVDAFTSTHPLRADGSGQTQQSEVRPRNVGGPWRREALRNPRRFLHSPLCRPAP